MNEKPARISWKIEEYSHREKTPDWFWALGVIAISGAVIAIIYHDIFFAVFLILSAFILGYYASRKPDIIEISISEEGIRVRDFLYPFKKIKSFAIDTHELGSYLLIETSRAVMPVISLPLPESMDIDSLKELLKTKLIEKPMKEPISHRVMEHLGF